MRLNPIFDGGLTLEKYLAAGYVVVRIAERETYIERVLQTLVPDARIEVVAQSFIQVPWLLQGTMRLSVTAERLAKVTAPVFDLAVVPAPFELPTVREMMQFHVTRKVDTGLQGLRQRLCDFSQIDFGRN